MMSLADLSLFGIFFIREIKFGDDPEFHEKNVSTVLHIVKLNFLLSERCSN